MKLSTLVLAGSLGVNAVIAVLLLSSPSPEERAAAAQASAAASAAAAAKAQAAALAAANRIDPQTWSGLSQGELSAVVARLRAEGFPLSLQRAILGALIAERFADRHEALAKMISAQPWWRGGIAGPNSDPQVIAARQQLQRDEKDALDQLLGSNPALSAYALAKNARQYGAELSPAKLSELERINADYAELFSQVRIAAQGILLPEDRERLAFLEKEKRADIAKLLSPEELFEYDLRTSPTAGQLRYQLSAFTPTDDEYRAIFRVQQAFDARFGGSLEFMTVEQRQQRYSAASQKELADLIQAVLPPDRFADYQLKTDGAYLQTNALITRLQLAPTVTAEVVAVQKDITKRAAALRSDPTLTPDQRTTQLGNLASEAGLRLTPLLGENGLTVYRQNQNTSYWLNNLRPAPPAPPAAPKKS